MVPLFSRLLSRLVCLFMCMHGLGSGAQNPAQVSIRFIPEYAGMPLQFENGTCVIRHAGAPITLTTFRLYISNIMLLQGEQIAWAESGSYHLLDLAETLVAGLMLSIPAVKYDHIRFNLGIDSVTNTKGAAGGDLDAVKGMYWAWHSGYINLKLEGSSPKCPTRKNEFQFHLGGFRENENCEQRLLFPVTASRSIEIGIDLSRFLNSIDLAKQHTEMTPGTEAVKLSAKAAQMFYLHPAKP